MQVQANRVNWGRQSSGQAVPSQFRCGRLLAEIHVRDGAIGLSSKTMDPYEREELSDLGEVEPRQWTQWAVCTGGDAIDLRPSLPDRSVLAEVAESFTVPSGESRRVYLRIPVTVVFQVNDQFDDILAELPSEELEKVWFGEDGKGEPCYHLPAALFHEGPLSIDEGSIQAPVTIWNNSDDLLEVNRLCLRMNPLAIYQMNDVLWTNETMVRFQGGMDSSKVAVRYGPPAEAPSATLITPARKKGSFTVAGRSFRSLRQWTGDLLA